MVSVQPSLITLDDLLGLPHFEATRPHPSRSDSAHHESIEPPLVRDFAIERDVTRIRMDFDAHYKLTPINLPYHQCLAGTGV